MVPGTPERRSHEDHRHGTVALFAALDIATGTVIGKTSARHASEDFKAFLDEIDRPVGCELRVHLICDNLSVHKAPAVKKWLLEHPRFELHFTPTYSSWLNQVEMSWPQCELRRVLSWRSAFLRIGPVRREASLDPTAPVVVAGR
jgi:transposase